MHKIWRKFRRSLQQTERVSRQQLNFDSATKHEENIEKLGESTVNIDTHEPCQSDSRLKVRPKTCKSVSRNTVARLLNTENYRSDDVIPLQAAPQNVASQQFNYRGKKRSARLNCSSPQTFNSHARLGVTSDTDPLAESRQLLQLKTKQLTTQQINQS